MTMGTRWACIGAGTLPSSVSTGSDFQRQLRRRCARGDDAPRERLGAPAVRVAASEYVKQRAKRGRRKEPRADTERRCYCPGTAARQFKTESVTQRATRTFDFDAPVTRQKPCVGPGPVPAPDASPGWLVRGR